MNAYLHSVWLIISATLWIQSCKPAPEGSQQTELGELFETTPKSITFITQPYESNFSSAPIKDMNEDILCISTKINAKSNTYFIQPDNVSLKELSMKYENVTVADMKTGLLIKDNESGKTTLFYLPGRFPIDSLKTLPTVTVPVMGITRYHSEIERISSRWTDVVCKCINKKELVDFTEHSINECITGGPEAYDCMLSNEGSILTCQTDCREGAVACCWFEF